MSDNSNDISVFRCLVGFLVFACMAMAAYRTLNGSWWGEYWLILAAWNLHTLLRVHESFVAAQVLRPMRWGVV